MKIYTFLDENERVIAEVRAGNHDIAIAITGLDFMTDFYSEEIEEVENMEEDYLMEFQYTKK